MASLSITLILLLSAPSLLYVAFSVILEADFLVFLGFFFGRFDAVTVGALILASYYIGGSMTG